MERLVRSIHHTEYDEQYYHFGHKAIDCILSYFQDADWGRNLTDSTSTSGSMLCTFRTHTFDQRRHYCTDFIGHLSLTMYAQRQETIVSEQTKHTQTKHQIRGSSGSMDSVFQRAVIAIRMRRQRCRNQDEQDDQEKGRSLTIRHVSRTHAVALDW